MFKKLSLIIIAVVFLLPPFVIHGADLDHGQYPKLANLFFRWDISADEVRELARWDILIIDMDVQTYSPQSLIQIKELNPKIKLLAYLASEELRGDSYNLKGTLRQKLFSQINDSWWLRDKFQNKVSWWHGNPMINVTLDAPAVNNERWQNVLARFVKKELMDSGYWDGVLFDNAWDDISFLKNYNIDLNQDGEPEQMNVINEKWRAGMRNLFETARAEIGSDKLIVGNGGEYYYQSLNGALYEHFPTKGWAAMMQNYHFINSFGQYPAFGIINSNVDNTGKKEDYKKMRFGLASALLDNGYFSFDNGDQSHREAWWYDEYEVNLGEPAGEPLNVLNNHSADFADGVWRRDFKNGLVIVNSGGKQFEVELGGEYEKIHGRQDLSINDGSFVSSVEINSRDGIILLRPIDKMENAVFANGSFAKIFNRYGHQARTGFFAYDDKFRGSSKIIIKDINGDGRDEFIVANENKVGIFDANENTLAEFYPYSEKYNKGVNIALGDLDNNGTLEIVTGTEKGGGPQIRIFDIRGELINPGFFAYGKNFRGGVNVALGDLEGDGKLEIIAGAGFGGGPHVRIFSSDGRLVNPGFFAYDAKFRGGVNVASGDIDGDGRSEIITGMGKGGDSLVKVFDKSGKIKIEPFYAFEKAKKGGVNVSAIDIDSDGLSEIAASTLDVFTLSDY